MARKKTGLGQGGLAGTLFTNINPYEGDKEKGEADVPRLLPLSAIRPDPSQPRRILPPDLSDRLAAGVLSPAEAMADWLARAGRPETEAAARSRLLELQRLAKSIEQHGLINPITVRRVRPEENLPPGVSHLIVTGERRYWAQVYLAHAGRQIHEGDTTADPQQIKVSVAAEGVSVRAHQLIENLLREDINAVEKARGMWALRYELSGVNRGSPPPSPGEKANHGSPLVPWERVQEALGISKRYRIFVTSVLNLCEEAQTLIAEHNLSERLVRPITQQLRNAPALQVQALRQIIAWQNEEPVEDGPGRSVSRSVQELVHRLLAEQPADRGASASSSTPSAPPPTVAQFHRKVRGALRYLSRLPEPDLADLTQHLATGDGEALIEDLQQLRIQIDTLLDAAARQRAFRNR